MPSVKPDIGSTVKDDRTGRLGRVMGHEGPYVQLRPVGGGREWDADPERLTPAALSDALSSAVAEVNARTAQGL